MPTRTRTTRSLTTTLLAGVLLLTGAGSALADGETERPDEAGEAAEPTEAGTTFRTATAITPGGRATARASTGDYLYWVVPAAAGQDVTVEATVTFPDTVTRGGPATWRLDLYDGLRRRQACVTGEPAVEAAKDAGSTELSCTLRTIRPWAEPWSNDPLPGAYYLRLTAVELPETDLGLPVNAEVAASVTDAGGAHAGGGELGSPLVQTSRAGTLDPTPEPEDPDSEDPDSGTGDTETEDEPIVLAEPDAGWTAGWWSDRWLWTVAGGVLGALAGLAGFTFVRRPRD